MTLNILRFKFYNISKKLNLSTNKNMRFIELKNILDEYFIKINSIKKIIKYFRIFKIKKSNEKINIIINENFKLKQEVINLKNLEYNKVLLNQTKEIFILKTKLKDTENKNINLNSILSNNIKLIKLLQKENDINENNDINYIINNKYNYDKIPKLSITKIKNELKANGIDFKDKSKHDLKRQLGQIQSEKFKRVTDKIYNLKK